MSADPASFRSAAEHACAELAASSGVQAGLLRCFDGSWAPLVGNVRSVDVAPRVLRVGDPVHLGPDWSLAAVADRDRAPFGALVTRGAQPSGVAGMLLTSATDLQGRLLEARAEEHARRLADIEPADGETDPDSGIGTGAYWTRCLLAEQARCAVLEHCATVLQLAPVARPGETWLEPCVAALRRSCRAVDVLARPEPGLLAVLAVECPESAAGALADRLRAAMLESGIAVGCGTASRWAGHGLDELVPAARDSLQADLAARGVLEL